MKRLSLYERAKKAVERDPGTQRMPLAQLAAARYGYMIGWQAAKRERRRRK